MFMIIHGSVLRVVSSILSLDLTLLYNECV
jgi:hypothetical protein